MATEIDCDLQECIHNPDDLGPCTAPKVELTIDPETGCGFLECFQYEKEKQDNEDTDQEVKPKWV